MLLLLLLVAEAKCPASVLELDLALVEGNGLPTDARLVVTFSGDEVATIQVRSGDERFHAYEQR